MNSMLYERTGLSTDKKAVLEKEPKGEKVNLEDIFRNPYVLEFLGLEEKAAYSETDLEQAIINHLQTFLLEMGRGFCFEGKKSFKNYNASPHHGHPERFLRASSY